MNNDNFDKEINAIKAVLIALEPLEDAARKSVLGYVFQRLGMTPDFGKNEAQNIDDRARVGNEFIQPPKGVIHIKQLKDEKQPQSAIEMAVLTAYYLTHVAEPVKATVTTADLDTYFKLAGFKLPLRQDFTLPNAKKAGYLDSLGGGEYKLNPVGYNLIAHNMPRAEGASPTPRRPRKTAPKKKATVKGKRA